MWLFKRKPKSEEPKTPPEPPKPSFTERHPHLKTIFDLSLGTAIFGTGAHFLEPSLPLLASASLGLLSTVAADASVSAIHRIKTFFTPRPPELKDIQHVHRHNAYGSGRFADPEKDTTNLGKEKTGILFGRSTQEAYIYTTYTAFLQREKKYNVGGKGGPFVFSTPNAHTLVCAPTRSGKGIGILVPTLLCNENSVLAIDPKGELAAITARNRRDNLDQDVFILNPWGLHQKLFEGYGFTEAHSFNPLDILDPTDPNIVSKAMFLAGLLVPHSSASDPYWDTEAQKILFGLMLYVTDKEPQNKHLPRVREIINRSQILTSVLAAMAASQAPIFGKVMGEIGDNFLSLSTKAEKTFASIIGNAQSHLRFLLDPVITAALEKSTFSFSQLRDTPTTVYLIIPPQHLNSHARWLRLMVGAAMNAFFDPSPPKQRCLFILEEFASLGHMQAIQDGVSTLAGYGVDLLFILQDLAQLKQIYGTAADSLIANSAFRFFTNIIDKTTAEYVSSCLGRETVTVVTGTAQRENQSFAAKPVKSPDELIRMGKGPAILFQPGTYPILLNLEPYYKNDGLAPFADPNPYRP